MFEYTNGRLPIKVIMVIITFVLMLLCSCGEHYYPNPMYIVVLDVHTGEIKWCQKEYKLFTDMIPKETEKLLPSDEECKQIISLQKGMYYSVVEASSLTIDDPLPRYCDSKNRPVRGKFAHWVKP